MPVIDPAKYPPNPERPKTAPTNRWADDGPTEKPKMDPVITGQVLEKKKNWAERTIAIIMGDDEKSIGSFLWRDVFVPAVKTTLYDIFVGGLEMRLFGETRSRSARVARDDRPGMVSYNGMFGGTGKRNPNNWDGGSRERVTEVSNFIFGYRQDAVALLNRLDDIIRDYQETSVADFYEALGKPSQYTDRSWGWKDISTSRIVPNGDGWSIDMPRATNLNEVRR